MAEPPPLHRRQSEGPSSFQKNLQKLHNSLEFSDVKLVIHEDPDHDSDEKAIEVNCHKNLLAIASRKFARLLAHANFNENYSIIKSRDHWKASQEGIVAVVRYIYGLPLVEGQEEEDMRTAEHRSWWKEVCNAADELGLPDLCKLASTNYKRCLIHLLTRNPWMFGFNDGFDTFCSRDLTDSDCSSEEATPAQMVLAQVCSEKYPLLRNYESFLRATANNPALLRRMLNYASRHRNGLLGSGAGNNN